MINSQIILGNYFARILHEEQKKTYKPMLSTGVIGLYSPYTNALERLAYLSR